MPPAAKKQASAKPTSAAAEARPRPNLANSAEVAAPAAAVEKPERPAEEYPTPRLHLYKMTPIDIDKTIFTSARAAPAAAPATARQARRPAPVQPVPTLEGGRWRAAFKADRLTEAAARARRNEAAGQLRSPWLADGTTSSDRLAEAAALREAATSSATARPTTGALVASRVFVLLTPRIVRRGFDPCSESVGTLPTGSRVHIVQSRRRDDGAHRAEVVLVGRNKPSGWLASRTAKGVLLLRAEGAADGSEGGAPAADAHAEDPFATGPLPQPHSARSYSTPLLHMPSPGTTPRRGGAKGGSSPLGGSHTGCASARSGCASARGGCFSARSSCPSARSSSCASARGVGGVGSSASAQGVPLLPAFHDSKFTQMQLQLERAAAAAAAEGQKKKKPAGKSAFLVRMEAQKNAKLGLNSWQRRLGPVIGNKKRWRALRRALLGDDAPPEAPRKSLFAAAKQAANTFKLRSKAELQAVAAEFEAKVTDERERVSDGTHKSLPVLVGEMLAQRNMKPNELVLQWAKRGEEPISKMEVRRKRIRRRHAGLPAPWARPVHARGVYNDTPKLSPRLTTGTRFLTPPSCTPPLLSVPHPHPQAHWQPGDEGVRPTHAHEHRPMSTGP